MAQARHVGQDRVCGPARPAACQRDGDLPGHRRPRRPRPGDGALAGRPRRAAPRARADGSAARRRRGRGGPRARAAGACVRRAARPTSSTPGPGEGVLRQPAQGLPPLRGRRPRRRRARRRRRSRSRPGSASARAARPRCTAPGTCTRSRAAARSTSSSSSPSVASILGAAGQANYAAANAVPGRAGRARRAAGLPALSIDWGPWAEVGMAAALRDGDQRRRGARAGPDQPRGRARAPRAARSEARAAPGRVLPIRLGRFRGPRRRAMPLLAAVLAEQPGEGRRRAAGGRIARARAAAAGAAPPATSAGPAARAPAATRCPGCSALDAAHAPGDPRRSRRPRPRLADGGRAAQRLGAARAARCPATLVFDYPTLEALGRLPR